MASTNNGTGFPEDLAMEILSRLPVKSLLRFKCGCKNWYALIKNPTFIKQHLNCGNNNKEPQLLIYHYGAQDDGSTPITLINSDGTPVENPVHYFQRFRGMTRLLGSVDGLFLLVREIDGIDISVALWNPATREVRPLPIAQFNREEVMSYNHFGFGLDPLTNDYKVVCFNFFHDSLDEEYRVYAAVYSCSRDMWRIFSPNNYKICMRRSCYDAYSTAYLNGAYYWKLTPGYTGGSKCTILSFDFSNEVFGEIEGPDGSALSYLILFDGSIALLYLSDLYRFCFDIRVMIKPGVWNKFLTFECFPHFLSWYSSTILLATKRSRLVSYNVMTKKTRHLGFCHRGLHQSLMELSGGCSVYCYRESLVSIERQGNGHLNHFLQLTRIIGLLDLSFEREQRTNQRESPIRLLL